MKLCKDCKYIVPPKDGRLKYGECSHPNNLKINVVTGETEYIWIFASIVRINNKFCGKDGNWFESKAPVLETYPEPKSFWKRILKK